MHYDKGSGSGSGTKRKVMINFQKAADLLTRSQKKQKKMCGIEDG